MWTAWPLEPKELPPRGILNQTELEDEEFTSRNPAKIMPSTDLEEEMTALILRFAKQRFDKSMKTAESDVPLQSVETAPNQMQGEASDLESVSIPSSPPMTPNQMDIDNMPSSPPPEAANVGSNSEWETDDMHEMEAEFIADDDKARELLRPSVRHFISKLDEILLVLQNSRLSCVPSKAFDPEPFDGDADDEGASKPRRQREKKRPANIKLDDSQTTADVEMSDAAPASNEDEQFEAWLTGNDQKKESEEDWTEESEEDAPNFNEVQRKWRLRDWSDIIGAASLADLPPKVLRRTAQRCANLFGQSMVLNRLPETSAAKGMLVDSLTIKPQRPSVLIESSDTDNEPGGVTLQQRLIVSGQTSRQVSRQASRQPSESSAEGRARTPSSRRSSIPEHSMGLWLCPVPSCPRSTQRFDRKRNLKRHIRVVHPDIDESASEVDSGDEMQGAVHVDGFLRPINPGKGWRGRDVNPRKRARSSSSTPATPARADGFSSGESEEL